MRIINFILLFLIIVQTGCSSTKSQTPSVQTSCLPIEADPSLIELKDHLFLAGKEIYMLDGNAYTKEALPHIQNNNFKTDVSNFIVSPDGEKAAYSETIFKNTDGDWLYGNEALKILSSGDELIVTNWHPDVETPIKWFDNNRILFTSKNYQDGTVFLLDPKTNMRQEIRPSFSDIYTLDPIPWYLGGNPLPIYNPTMSLVFYLRDSVNGMEYVLKNLETQEELWSGLAHNPSAEPKWSTIDDELLLAIPKNNPENFEFFSIDQNGQEIQLSDYSSAYPSTYIWGFDLSPTGQYIGFWLDGRSSKNEYSPHFAILDIKTKQTIDFCLGPGEGKIIWSPEGNQVAIKLIDSNNSNSWNTVIVDIKKKIAVKVANQEYPIGWLKSR